jgi:hypothetical protein
MSTNVVNTVAYLRTSRDFKNEEDLPVILDKMYIDVANAVNNRTIGIFPTTRPAIGGESWFIRNNQRQQNFRQVYLFTTTASIDIGFKISSISRFTKPHGEYLGTSGDWYGLINGTPTAIPGQISFYLHVNASSKTSDQIIFVVDGAAPALASGTIVLEWLSAV